MKEITKTFKIYEFKELSENAKEKAKSDYLSGQFLVEDLYQNFSDMVQDLFPNSDLDVQFSLTNCQGDGVNIYGNLNLIDIFNLIKDKLTPEQQSILNNIFKEYIDNVELAHNHHYSYLKLCSDDIYYEMRDTIQYDDESCLTQKVLNTLVTFSHLAYEYILNWCNDMEDDGYKYLYEISDDDMQKISMANNWHYLENGEFYCDY